MIWSAACSLARSAILRTLFDERTIMNSEFTPDNSLQQIAQAFSQEAVEFAAKKLRIDLDYSDASIQLIETILGAYHHCRSEPDGPSEEHVQRYAQIFGSYIGETFRRNHAATWGSTPNDGSKMPSMRSDHTTTVFFPWARAYNRITKGDTEGVTVYYQYLVDDLKGNSLPPPLPTATEKKSLFGRFFGK